jgi:cell fate (sporulation/competence/biofilm development) regulator YlbF (YheA/YmcA/DUF963 family)
MRLIDEKTFDLLEVVKESPEYQKYQEMKTRLKQEPELEKAVNELRRQTFEIQKMKHIDLYDEMDKLEEEKSRLFDTPIVEEYLAAELAFCRIIQRINWKLLEELDFEVGFDDEGVE